MLSLTAQSLAEYTDNKEFERLCADFLNATGYTEVVPVGVRGGGDGGMDILYKAHDGTRGLACVTIRKDIDKKFTEDFYQREKDDFDHYIFFTNQYLTPTRKKKFTKYCLDQLDALFIPMDIEFIRSLLDTSLQGLRAQYLHIDPEKNVTYEISATDVRKYSVANLLQSAKQTLAEKTARFKSMSSVVNVLPVSFAAFGGQLPPEEILANHAAYIEELEELDHRLTHVCRFNILISTSAPDTNIEVRVEAPPNSSFSYGNTLIELPDLPKEEKASIFSEIMIPSITSFTHHIQGMRTPYIFDTSLTSDKKEIVGNLEIISAGQTRQLMGRSYFIVGHNILEPLKLNIMVTSTNLVKPIKAIISIPLFEAAFIELSRDVDADKDED